MHILEQALQKNPIVYVTRDRERALGIPENTPGYYIISNKPGVAKLDTWQLLEQPETIGLMASLPKASIVVFKNTSQIEAVCKKYNWRLLNPPAALSAKVEEKISQVEWLGKLKKYLPPHHIDTLKNIAWDACPAQSKDGAEFILQFNRAHTGLGTTLVQSKEQLQALQEKFPNRPVRVTQYINGPMFTNNNVVTRDTILVGNINYQITGLPPFTDQAFATIGNEWTLPGTLLSARQKKQYGEIATAVGLQLRASGWRGLFGIDAIKDTETGKLFLIEINARQPASTTFESQLQQSYKLKTKSYQLTTFEAHLLALLDADLKDTQLIPVTDGSQIILRVQPTKNFDLRSQILDLESSNFNVIQYDNTTPGSDLIRIQSQHGIMSDHNQFDDIGQEILRTLS
ncbi:MAG: hypothetical protein AAB408_04980 [Patescibacteria group bacterium]